MACLTGSEDLAEYRLDLILNGDPSTSWEMYTTRAWRDYVGGIARQRENDEGTRSEWGESLSFITPYATLSRGPKARCLIRRLSMNPMPGSPALYTLGGEQ